MRYGAIAALAGGVALLRAVGAEAIVVMISLLPTLIGLPAIDLAPDDRSALYALIEDLFVLAIVALAVIPCSERGPAHA